MQPIQELWLKDILPDLGEVLAQSAQGLVHKYKDKYVIKLRDEPEQVNRELELMKAAGELCVNVVGYVYTGPPKRLEGFVMPLLSRIYASSMSLEEKLDLYRQMSYTIENLHLHGVIHGDVNPSNVLLDADKKVKLCDFGTSAFIGEKYFPSAFTLRYCALYRLREDSTPPLVPEEDIYALGVTVWELMTGRKAFEEIDDEEELEEMIKRGKKVDVESVQVDEVKRFIQKCLDVFENM